MFKKWLHHLFNPHCEECLADEQEKKICESCEILKHQLNVSNTEKAKLIDALINQNKGESISITEEPLVIPKPRFPVWSVQRQQLEMAERRKAEQIRNNKESELKEVKKSVEIKDTSLEELEKELGVVDG